MVQFYKWSASLMFIFVELIKPNFVRFVAEIQQKNKKGNEWNDLCVVIKWSQPHRRKLFYWAWSGQVTFSVCRCKEGGKSLPQNVSVRKKRKNNKKKRKKSRAQNSDCSLTVLSTRFFLKPVFNILVGCCTLNISVNCFQWRFSFLFLSSILINWDSSVRKIWLVSLCVTYFICYISP